VRFVDEETIESKPGCDLILARFVEVLLIEALRTMPSGDAPPRLLHALADPRLAPAIRQMHNHIARSWTVAALAKASASSRSAFFERFTRMVGVPPTDYLLRWRMAVAKRRLRTENAVAEVAECDRLWIREYLQHSVQPARGPGAGPLCACGCRESTVRIDCGGPESAGPIQTSP